jgi:GNAT superfamily N-acetyltransferase
MTNHGLRTPQHSIHQYTTSAIPPILDLVRQVLGDSVATRKTEDYWHWKHHQNPFGASYGLYTWDEETRRVTGLRILMRWRFQTPRGKSVLAVRAVDTATHPDCRRQGIFSTLTRQAVADLDKEGLHLIFNTPNRDTSLPGYLKMGWQVVTNWPVYVKPLKPARVLLQMLRLTPQKKAQMLFESCFGERIVTWEAFEASQRRALPALISAAEESRPVKGLRTVRDLPYLHWRYGQHPHIHYGVYALEDTEGLAGFAVMRPNTRRGLQEVVLTELVLRDADVALGRRLLKQLLREVRGDYLVTLFVSGTLEHEVVKRTGFIRVPRQGILFAVRLMNPFQQDPLDPANWDLCLGDLDLF